MSGCGAVISSCYQLLQFSSRHRDYSTVIVKNNGNPKALWNTFKNKSSTIILPDHISPTDLANTFGFFFSDKMLKIIVALQSSVPASDARPRNNNSALSSFEAVSGDHILKILNSFPTKSRDRDPIPTSLVKECTEILVIIITKIINHSLEKGVSQTASKLHMSCPSQEKQPRQISFENL